MGIHYNHKCFPCDPWNGLPTYFYLKILWYILGKDTFVLAPPQVLPWSRGPLHGAGAVLT